MSTAVVQSDVLAIAPASAERFYVRMAVACLAVAVIGFAPTYWIPLLRGTLDVPPILHIHAALFYGWTLLFLRQTSLAAAGRLHRHRELGVAGVAVATAMFFVGTAAAINSLKRFEAAGIGDAARSFSLVSFSAIALFAVLFALAVYNVRKPDVHKRLMLVATVSLLQAAVGRWFVFFLGQPAPEGGLAVPPPIAVTITPGVLSDLLIIAAMIHDRRMHGKIHRVYWIAGGAVLAVQLLRIPISTTGAWIQVTHWLVALAP